MQSSGGRARAHAIDLTNVLRPAHSNHQIAFNPFKACKYKVKKITPLVTIPEDSELLVVAPEVVFYDDSIWDWPS